MYSSRQIQAANWHRRKLACRISSGKWWNDVVGGGSQEVAVTTDFTAVYCSLRTAYIRLNN